ncbi:MAG: hypothetical protein J6Y37_16220 [Paludibacteraceae bacterium]|nr:hypothetical protein [Paludibacteraceae bacterium]
MWQEGTELIIKEKNESFMLPIGIACLWVCVLVMMYFSCREYVNWTNALSFSFLGILILTILCVIFKKKKGKKRPIIVSKEGILLAEQGLIEWNRIEYAYIRGFKYHYIVLEVTRANNVEYLINNYIFNEEEFSRAVNYWSGRKIGSIADKKEDIEETYAKYRSLFEKERKKEKMIVGIVTTLAVILPIGFLVYNSALLLDTKPPIVSLFAVLFGCISYLAFIYNSTTIILREMFLRTPPIAQLAETEIAHLSQIFLDENDYSLTKNTTLIAGIIMITSIIVYNLQ